MNNLPKVSIIIPSLNAQDTIKECLESIKLLNYPKDKIETVLVDNGSNDNTLDIAKHYNVRILSEPNLKVGGLRNRGAEVTTYEVLAHTDSDCILDRNWLCNSVIELVKPKYWRLLVEMLLSLKNQH